MSLELTSNGFSDQTLACRLRGFAGHKPQREVFSARNAKKRTLTNPSGQCVHFNQNGAYSTSVSLSFYHVSSP